MLYSEEARSITLAAAGDMLITRKLSPFDEPAHLHLWKTIQSAAVRFANLEMLIHDFEGYPTDANSGMYVQVGPKIIGELLWSGMNLFSRANNHALDYSVEAMRRTSQLLDDAGLCHAGVGENLAEARSPRYLDLKEARVALISASSTFAPFMRAGEQRPDVKGRPGLNPLRYTTTYAVTQAQLGAVQQVSEALGLEEQKAELLRCGFAIPRPGEFRFDGLRFVLGDKPEIRMEIHPGDLAGNLMAIDDARFQATFVVFSLHAHESGISRSMPAPFHQPFARACIDAGVDIFLGHGPHIIRGLEIYKGKPIFYSLGNFVFQNTTIRKQPWDNYELFGLGHHNRVPELYNTRSANNTREFPADPWSWQGIVPWCRYEAGRLAECKLYPVSLGFGIPGMIRGRPMLAQGELAAEIIGRLSALSRPFGTEVRLVGDVGEVKL